MSWRFALWLAGRLGDALVACWGIVTIVFVAGRLLGDPVLLMLPDGPTEQQVQELRAALGLDRPILVQYLEFLGHAATGDFGWSFQYRQPAADVVLRALPATAQLATVALAVAVLLGAGAGFLSASRSHPVAGRIAMAVTLLGQATPSFWVGIMAIMVFSVWLGWLPTGGTGGLQHLVLPALTLGTFTAAGIARLLRSSLRAALSEDYVRTAWAKGLTSRAVHVDHAARNALIPVVTMVGILAGELLGGTVVVETIFAWPGVGRVIVQSIEAKDFAVTQAGVLLVSVTFILVNLAVDLLYAVLDPRVRIVR